MAVTTKVKGFANRVLLPFNLRIDTLTGARRERERLRAVEAAGYFEDRIYPVSPPMERMNPDVVLTAVERFRDRFDTFREPGDNPVGYTFRNEYFSSPDAEVLYALVRTYRPARIVEVGSGFSTQLSRLAIDDGAFDSRLLCIDPRPRRDVTGLPDELLREPVERIDMSRLTELEEGDILFIDSSHRIRPGNDVDFLFLQVLPFLRRGVLIHVHDIFLPYAYPRDWVVDEPRHYTEQYLVQSMLQFSDAFEVLWAGHFLQRSRPDFERLFPHWTGRDAKSLWLRTTDWTGGGSGAAERER